MVVRRLLAGIIVALALTGCNSEPPVREGKIVDRRFTPAHWESGYRSEGRYGYHCGMGSYDMDYTCGFKHYTERIYEEQHHYVEDTFELQLESCSKNDDGKLKCRTGRIYVPESEYDDYSIGSTYPRPR